MKVHAKKTFGKPTSYAFSDNTSDTDQQSTKQAEESEAEDSDEDEDSEDENDDNLLLDLADDDPDDEHQRDPAADRGAHVPEAVLRGEPVHCAARGE